MSLSREEIIERGAQALYEMYMKSKGLQPLPWQYEAESEPLLADGFREQAAAVLDAAWASERKR